MATREIEDTAEGKGWMKVAGLHPPRPAMTREHDPKACIGDLSPRTRSGVETVELLASE